MMFNVRLPSAFLTRCGGAARSLVRSICSPGVPRAVVGLVLVAGVVGCSPTPPPPPAQLLPDTPVLERFEVDSDGHPMALWGRVPEEATAVVLLLHGRTWSSLPDFDLQVEGESLSLMEAMADRGIATYALDARGYGETPRMEDGWLNPDRMAQDVANVLRWISARHPGQRPPAIMGWSFGSTTAHLAAQRWPELPSGLAVYGYWKHPDAAIPVGGDSAEPARSATTEEGARSDFIVEGSISQAAVDAFVVAALAADPVRVDVRRQYEFNALSPDSLTVPVLILQGEFDPIAPTATQAALFERLGTGHKAWVVLPGCDHAAHMEVCRPRFVGSLYGFVMEVAGGG